MKLLLGAMIVLYIPACIGLIIVVLLQKGKGTSFAGAFGMGGGGDAVFGPRSGKSLMTKLTTTMAALYLILAFGLTLVVSNVYKGDAPEKVESKSMVAVSEELDELMSGDEAESTEAATTEATEEAAPEADATTETAEEPASEATEEAAPEAEAAE